MVSFARNNIEEMLENIIALLSKESKTKYSFLLKVNSQTKKVEIVASIYPKGEYISYDYLESNLYLSPVRSVIEKSTPFYAENINFL